jgi:hypothetical protein
MGAVICINQSTPTRPTVLTANEQHPVETSRGISYAPATAALESEKEVDWRVAVQWKPRFELQLMLAGNLTKTF